MGAAKLDLLADQLTEVTAEGHQALVFSTFTSFLRRARDRVTEEGIATVYLDGSTRDREAVIHAFRRGDAPVFLISLKAGGVGLVNVYRLVATDTIEEKVVALKARRAELFAKVMDGGGAATTGITAADIRRLFD